VRTGPQQPGYQGSAEVAERLNKAEDPEPVATQVFRQQLRHNGRLGRLGEADAHPGEHEPKEQDRPGVLLPGEHGIPQHVDGRSGGEHQPWARPVCELAAADRR